MLIVALASGLEDGALKEKPFYDVPESAVECLLCLYEVPGLLLNTLDTKHDTGFLD